MSFSFYTLKATHKTILSNTSTTVYFTTLNSFSLNSFLSNFILQRLRTNKDHNEN
nr:MAG TPA: hypothetical protein [Caudoviricetes sp.]